jgi:hypothetical protein
MSTPNEIKHEPKAEFIHDEGDQTTPPTGGVTGKISGLVVPAGKTADGDLGANWLEEYTGERTELGDEDNKRVRNRIDRHLMPMYVFRLDQITIADLLASFTSTFVNSSTSPPCPSPRFSVCETTPI